MRPRTRIHVAGLLVLVCALVAPGLAGCAALQPTPTRAPVTLRYASIDSKNVRYTQLSAQFRTRYPHITIEMVGQSLERADVAMAPVLEAGQMIQDKAVIALDPYAEGDGRYAAEAFVPGTLDMLRSGGRLWGIPAGVDPLVLYYNQDLFDAAGAAYPQPGWNWDDFLTRADALTNPATEVYGYWPMEPTAEVIGFIYQHGGGFLDSLTNPTRPTFNDPRNAEAIEWWLSLAHTHGVAPTAAEQSAAGSPQAAVYANKAGMWMGFLTDRGGSPVPGASSNWPAPWKMRWGVASVPRDAASSTIAMVGAYFISAQCKNPDAAWAWISFLSEQTVHEAAPARLAVLQGADYEKLVGKEVATTARAVLKDAQMLSPRVMVYAGAFETLGSQMQGVMRGTTSVQDALDLVQKVAERAQP